jgi:hypothetical protein
VANQQPDALQERQRGVRRQASLSAEQPSVAFQICAHTATEQGLDGIALDHFRELASLARRVREVETDPAQGRWIWLRITATPSHVELTRAHDHLPYWWEGEPQGLWLSDLRDEIEHRAPAWRPRWTDLLEPRVAWETVPVAGAQPAEREDRS